MVAQWRADISSEALGPPPPAGSAQPATSRASGASLRRVIWDPLAAHLGEARHLFVVPDGELGMIPMAALPVGGGSYLLETGPVIHYLSAERDLLAPSEAGSKRGLLALGGPAFGGPAVSPAPSAATLRAPSAGCTDFRSISFPPLGGTVQEAKEVASLWNSSEGGGSDSARLLVGREAGETIFKHEAQRYRVLHVATHGFFLNGACAPTLAGTRGVGGLAPARPAPVANPLLLSGLALAGANRRERSPKPTKTTASSPPKRWRSLDLQGVEWAVLSACDTGVGEIKAGEGVFGLRRAFQVAGARTVIMSLWSVDDQATRAWMRALYEGRFQKRLSTADAVHQASLSVLRDRRARGQSTHPFFWAAFVAAGDWR